MLVTAVPGAYRSAAARPARSAILVAGAAAAAGLMTEGILGAARARGLVGDKRGDTLQIHGFLQSAGATLAGLGFWAIWRTKAHLGKPHFATLHGKVCSSGVGRAKAALVNKRSACSYLLQPHLRCAALRCVNAPMPPRLAAHPCCLQVGLVTLVLTAGSMLGGVFSFRRYGLITLLPPAMQGRVKRAHRLVRGEGRVEEGRAGSPTRQARLESAPAGPAPQPQHIDLINTAHCARGPVLAQKLDCRSSRRLHHGAKHSVHPHPPPPHPHPGCLQFSSLTWCLALIEMQLALPHPAVLQVGLLAALSTPAQMLQGRRWPAALSMPTQMLQPQPCPLLH